MFVFVIRSLEEDWCGLITTIFMALVLVYLSVFVLASARAAMQTTDTILMISPDFFAYNAETATSNAFQNKFDGDESQYTQRAKEEFNEMVSVLRKNGVRVQVLPSIPNSNTPDAVFPNNWFSTHVKNGHNVLVTYPMHNENRRRERQVDNVRSSLSNLGIRFDNYHDFTVHENHEKALEGTGSMVIDRRNGVIYAALSPRTDADIINEVASALGYSVVTFHAHDRNNALIYHTNVMMSVANDFAVICDTCITDMQERIPVIESLQRTGHTIISITQEQILSMCGNILEIRNTKDEPIIAMSTSAQNGFTKEQLQTLRRHGRIASFHIPTIETIGGGSVRCMMAEVFYEQERRHEEL